MPLRPASRAATSLLLAAALPACGAPPPPAAPTVQVAVPEAPAEEAGPPGYRCDGVPYREDERDYCVYSKALPWLEAKRACADSGGQLVSLGTEGKARALFAALGAVIGQGEGLWFGLREPQPGRWRWLDGAAPAFSAWNTGEPNDDGGDEDCAEWKLGTGTWNDAPCWSPRGYICERAGSAALLCDDSRPLRTDGGEYCFHLAEPLSWEEAKAECAASGGTLALLTTATENELLYKAAGPRVHLDSLWTGFNDIAREGAWRWVSGDRAGRPAWKEDEPNDFQDDEDCAEWFAESGMMNDLSCAARRPYICEPARPPPE